MTAAIIALAVLVTVGGLAALAKLAFWLIEREERPGRHQRPGRRERQRAEDVRWLRKMQEIHAEQHMGSLPEIDAEVSITLGHALTPLWDGPPPLAPHLHHYEDPRVVEAAVQERTCFHPEGYYDEHYFDDLPLPDDDDIADEYVGDVGPGERLPDLPDRLALRPVASQGQPPESLYDRGADHWAEESIIMPAVQ